MRPRLPVLLTACLLLSPAHALAAITATGDVDPNPPLDAAQLDVGETGYGSVTIDGGSQFINSGPSGGTSVGLTGIGSVLVSGDGSYFETGNLLLGGGSGSGELRIEQGGAASMSGTLELGRFRGGAGRLTVNGPRSAFFNSGASVVGADGDGSLEVLGGATALLNGAVFLSENSGRAEVVVSGDGSLLKANGVFRVGPTAEVVIADGGTVDTQLSTFELGTASELRLDDGNLFAEEITIGNGAQVHGDGRVLTQSAFIFSSGRVSAEAGQTLSFEGQGFFENRGSIAALGGQVEFTGLLTNIGSGGVGEIELRDGAVRAKQGAAIGGSISNSIRISATGGENHVYAPLTNNTGASIAVTGESTLFFHDAVDDQGGEIVVMPGSRAVFLDGLTLAGTLLANIAGTDSNTGFGVAEVVGGVNLTGGSVGVALTAGFEPELGDSFRLLSASGGVSGTPALGATPALPDGLAWRLTVEPNAVLLAVVDSLPGDFNSDGFVDTADFTVWRDNFGEGESILRGNGDGSGTVDVGDYQLWRSEFGSVAGAPAIVAAPEPLPVSLLVSTLALVVFRRRTACLSVAPTAIERHAS